jgi:hypothetical protein
MSGAKAQAMRDAATRCGPGGCAAHRLHAKIGRGERIRTSGPCLPKTVLYQAELLPDRTHGPSGPAGLGVYRGAFRGLQAASAERSALARTRQQR